MLTLDEEVELVRRAKAGDSKAVRSLVDAHIPLIVSTAAKYSRFGPDHDDLVQEAKLGMVAGINKFEPEKGFRLSTYARFWVKAMVADYVRENRSMIRIGTTATQKKLFSRLKSAKIQLGITSEHLTADDLARLSHHLGENADEIQAMDQRLAPNAMLSLNVGRPATNDGTDLIERIVDESTSTTMTDERIDEDRRMHAILGAIDKLDDRARDIVKSRFLVDEALTLEELSARHGVTRERIRQIEVKALDDMRGMLPNKLSRRLGIREPAVL